MSFRYDDVSPAFTYATEAHTLERLRIGAQGSVPQYILDNLTIERWVDDFSQNVMFRFRSEVLAKTLGTSEASQAVTFESPASTWQMFKHRHEGGRWLGWLARRWPVRMETTTKYAHFQVKEAAAFPDATIRFPKELGRPTFYQTVEAL